jgi:uncharacterized protein (DUF1800 family)
MAARAFTGWTFRQPIPLYPYGFFPVEFAYRAEDHDDSVKTFLGQTGRFDGEDIVDIIVRQPATARFIARHLYNFFVADEPQVPAWSIVPPQDPAAVETLVRAYVDSDGDVRSMLRVLFNADFFKAARLRKLKSPTELVVGTVKLVGTHTFPNPGLLELEQAAIAMGQQIMNPPTVEGWHTGREWIDGGTLNERVNFAVNQVADPEKPGLRALIDRLSARAADGALTPEQLVDGCLDLVGPFELGSHTRGVLIEAAAEEGALGFGSDEERQRSAARVSRMLQLILASREYQFA